MKTLIKNIKGVLVVCAMLAMLVASNWAVEQKQKSVEVQVQAACEWFNAMSINGQDYICYPASMVRDSI